MIQEKKLELVDKGSFMNYLVSEIRAQEGGADVGLNTTITLYDLTRKLFSFPAVNEQEAEWIKDSIGWYCSWCLMGVLRDDSGALVRTRYCPRCGCKMRK